MKSPAAHPVFQLIPALWIFWSFGIQTVGARLWLDVNGVVTQSEDLTRAGAPRFTTSYVLQDADHSPTTYVAGPTDASLPRQMPVGTVLHKHRWELSYEKDGQIVNDFPVRFYSGMMGLAVGFAIWSFIRWRALRPDYTTTG